MSDIEPMLSFIDANVWLYAFLQDQDKSATAETVIRSSEVVISTQVINEVCVNLIRKARFDEDTVRDLIDSFYSKYRVVGISQAEQINASRLRERYGFSYWDSLIVACGLGAGAKVLYSEDLHSGLSVEGRLQIVNPFTG
ncbi:MAG: PIN domain-containing protein [Acidobacteriota bacterium]|nr:PIN domain-containing protein [Acidobacteriota bacterium]